MAISTRGSGRICRSQTAERPDRYSSAVLPRLSAKASGSHDFECLDLVQVPTVGPASDWAWMVLSTAATTTYTHTIGLNHHEHWRFVTWAFGEERAYVAAYGQPLAHDHISRAYGKDAASRARGDHPAVQLRLTRLHPGS